MNNKEQLQKQADKLQEELDKLKQQIEECDDEKTDRVFEGNIYYYIDDISCCAEGSIEENTPIDNDRFETGNYFKTKEEAEQYIKNLKTKMKLKRLAKRLNKGVEFDWEDVTQRKYYIKCYLSERELQCDWVVTHQSARIYCLDKDFLNIAIQEIGKQALIDYLKSGV